MAKLTEDIKAFIVMSLARYQTQADTVAAVKEHFDIEITPQQVNTYNPATKNGERLTPVHKKLFKDTRDEFLKDIKGIPIANQAVRLQILDRAAAAAAARKNYVLAAQMAEQAAKEVGGVFTNHRKLEHDVPPGGTIQTLLGRIGNSAMPIAKTVPKRAKRK